MCVATASHASDVAVLVPDGVCTVAFSTLETPDGRSVTAWFSLLPVVCSLRRVCVVPKGSPESGRPRMVSGRGGSLI